MTSFKKFPLSKWRWYVLALRHNPDFRRECDEAVKDFLNNKRPDILEALKSRPDQFGEDPYKSPAGLREFVNSRAGEDLGQRWGLVEGWHYDCPDFPIPEKYYSIVPISTIPVSMWEEPTTPEYLILKVDLSASKKDLLEQFAYQIDRFKTKKTRGEDKNTTFPFKIYELYQKKSNFWKVTCELYPEVSNQNHQIDDQAKARYEEVKRAYRKAQRWISSIKPTK